MSIHKGYSKSTGAFQEDDEAPQTSEVDAGRLQLHHNWMQSTVTKEMFQDLTEQENKLINNSIVLATTNGFTDNTKQIIQNLVRIDTIRTIKKTYVSPIL